MDRQVDFAIVSGDAGLITAPGCIGRVQDHTAQVPQSISRSKTQHEFTGRFEG